MIVLYPCHNWLPTALKQFVIVNLAFRTSCRFGCTMHRICFMRENSRIRSPLNSEHVQNSESTLGDSNCCIGSHEHSHNVAQRCVNSQQCCTNFEGHKMIRTFVCVCYTTMRVLLDLSHMIVQRCTKVARLLFTSIDVPFKQAIFFRPDLTFKREP